MSSWKDGKFFEMRAIYSPLQILKNSVKVLVCAGIQVAGGAILTAYTCENSPYWILFFICSVIMIGGTYNIFKIMLKNMSLVFIETDNIQSTWELASAAITYSAGVYGFSESLKQENKIWIPCIALAAYGYYFCVSAVDDMVTVCNKSIFLTCCQLMFGPALILCSFTFLLYFRNHEESFLYWLPFAAIGAIGFKIACEGFSKPESGYRKLLLLKVRTTLIGGCLLAISSIVLMTVYGSIHNFPLIWTVSTMTVTSLGVIFVHGSLTCLRRYIGVDKKVFYSVVGLVAGPLAFFSTCLTIHFVEDASMVYFIFLFLAGLGHVILSSSIYHLYNVIHAPSLKKRFLHVLGPHVAIYSFLATECIAYQMSWWFCLVTIPFISAELYSRYIRCKRDLKR